MFWAPKSLSTVSNLSPSLQVNFTLIESRLSLLWVALKETARRWPVVLPA